MTDNAVAARIAALVRKHAQPSSKLPGLEEEVAQIAAQAIAAAKGYPLAQAAAVTLEWFKLANRAEIKLSADTTMQLSISLAQSRGQRVVLVFANPEAATGEIRYAETAQQMDLVEEAQAAVVKKEPAATPSPSATTEPVREGMPDLPKELDRRKKKATPKKVEPEPEPPQQAAAPQVAEPWIGSVDEPDAYDPDQSPAVH